MTKHWQPINDNVLLELKAKLPELYRAKVVAVGPGFLTYSGKRVPVDVKVGDVVLVGRHACQWVFQGKKKLLLIHGTQIRLRERTKP